MTPSAQARVGPIASPCYANRLKESPKSFGKLHVTYKTNDFEDYCCKLLCSQNYKKQDFLMTQSIVGHYVTAKALVFVLTSHFIG